MSQQTKQLYEFGRFRLDAEERLLLCNGAIVPLTPKAFDLLFVLVARHGHLLEKEEIFKTVWPGTFVEESNLTSNIALIRKTLGESGNSERYIETVPKRGYRFVVEVREVIEERVEINEPTPAAENGGRETTQAASAAEAMTKEATRHKRGLALALTILIAAFSGFGFWLYQYSTRPSAGEVVRSFILPPDGSSFNFTGFNAGPGLTVSPDGRRLAFVSSTTEGKNFLWVRALNAFTAQTLAGTEGASHPFWSPDSRFLGFFAEGKLKKIEAEGGPALTLCDAPHGRGGTWNRGGVIVFAPDGSGALHRVSDSGGISSLVTKLDETRGEVSHQWPYFLPDGQHFLYLGVGKGEMGGICVDSLDEPGSKLLLRAHSNAAYAQGYLLFVREGTLVAQPFDTQGLETAGEAFPIAEQVQKGATSTRGVFSVSEQGVLAYQTGAAARDSQLTWFDRHGKSLGVLGELAPYINPKLSPDGQRAAVTLINPQTGRLDIWLYEVARGIRTRFTFDPAAVRAAIWSPDGSHIIFNSDRKGNHDLYLKGASGVDSEELLLESDLDKHPVSWSADGRFLLYQTFDPKTKFDAWILPLGGDPKPFPFLKTEFNETFSQFSPDGRWIAYTSDESRRNEVYVLPFPGPGAKRQISTSGGQLPRWRGDGKEIFFIAPDNKLMAAEVNGQGAMFEVGTVRPLFEAQKTAPGYFYDVTSDGQRFLVGTAVEQRARTPITLVLNWTAELKR
jgi:DNA-binding winged helix-turn-helix (wHTH) protein/Tol biopolymer transport system component